MMNFFSFFKSSNVSPSTSPQSSISIENDLAKMKKDEISFNSAMRKWNSVRDGIDRAKKSKKYLQIIDYVDKGIILAKERPDLCIVTGLLEKDAALGYERAKDYKNALMRYEKALTALEKENQRLFDSERVVKNKLLSLRKKLETSPIST
jgi:hypothetical protein